MRQHARPASRPAHPHRRGGGEALSGGARGDGDWRDRAVCAQVDPELFFPTATQGKVYEAQVAAAKSVCAGCPVRAECLAHALTALSDGIAAGLTAEERRGLAGSRRSATSAGAVEPVASATGREVAEFGTALLAEGASVQGVARRCGVSERTVLRWATELRKRQVAA